MQVNADAELEAHAELSAEEAGVESRQALLADAQFLQVRINYHGGNLTLHQKFLTELQSEWGRQYFFRWTLGRGWQNGPHLLLTIDQTDYFFKPVMVDRLRKQIQTFLDLHPSPAYDADKYLEVQAKLNRIEAAGIDETWLEANNTFTITAQATSSLARRYESTAQWHSIFESEIELRPIAIKAWQQKEELHRTVFYLLVLLGAIYPPSPSDDPEVNEFNGFLSFYSNFRFWHHRLTSAQQASINARFTADYTADHEHYTSWLSALVTALQNGDKDVVGIAKYIHRHYFQFIRMAQEAVIHARSPYAPAKVADKHTLSDFHQRYFHTDDGSASQFSIEFSAYRWLLNIVYRNLPLFEIAPLKRQYLNFALDQLQREHGGLIAKIRYALLTC